MHKYNIFLDWDCTLFDVSGGISEIVDQGPSPLIELSCHDAWPSGGPRRTGPTSGDDLYDKKRIDHK